jgi:molybdopterin/thiamine biosynthesis adenylyltransferase
MTSNPRLRIVANDEAGSKPDFFARQRLIPGWDQARISTAKVMVVGAGALGNETIKNLMLLGFAHLFICDFDHVEDSNLSRTVLFRKEDIGKSKAEAAAQRARELSLVDDPAVSWFHGDITKELGLGVFQEFDVVLGCLDNIEARMFVNRCCLRTGTPWIDSGINGLSGHVMAFAPPDGACYECGLSGHQLAKGRERYACGLVKRRYFEEGKVATVQVTSSIIAGILTQECLKLLCRMEPLFGRRLYFQGAYNDIDINNLRRRASCEAHVSLPPVRDVALSRDISLRDLLTNIEIQSEGPVVLDLHDGLYRGFVTRYSCSLCDKEVECYRPTSDLFDTDLFCDDHTAEEINSCKAVREPGETLASFSLRDTEARILDLPLASLGVPAAHILGFRRPDNSEFAIRMAGDLDRLVGAAKRTA